jgi:ATP-dependent DNA ligase
MSDFPPLCGEATTGKTKVWSIRVFERMSQGVIQTTHGYLNGKMQVNEKIISQGKNIGKKNETSALEQAVSEARATWVKKIESGYAESILGTLSADVDEKEESAVQSVAQSDTQSDTQSKARGKGIHAEVPLPMLAHDYHKRGKSALFPCFVQPKLDGTRCVGMPGNGLFSRLRKSFPHMEHILSELHQLPPEIILDGELYSSTLTFQEIVGLVKRETLRDGDAEKQRQIQFHVYDIITDMPFHNRLANLKHLFQRHKFQHLVLVPTEMCESEEKMKEKHAAYVLSGYEGIMLRTKLGAYKHSRSVDLLKYKEFLDDEYEVVGFEQGQGLEEGCVIWVCCTAEQKTFHCRPRGTRESRGELFQNGADYIGKKLTVRFQELTDERIPRFPVGIAFRDYE